MKNKIIAVLLVFVFVVSALCGCSVPQPEKSDGLNIVCSIFAPFDFVRHVVGDKADVKMLLPPGVESHSFEPSPADIIALDNADIFFYVNENTETWVSAMLDSVKVENVVDMAKYLKIEVHEHDHEHEEEEREETEKDEHIWTNMDIAIRMVGCVVEKLSEIDPENADYYYNNAKSYVKEIAKLRDDFSSMISNAKRKEIVSGSRFALKNFTDEFGLEYTAAFDSCVDNTEPSAGVMANIIDTINNDKIPVVFYEELTEPKIARAVSIETGAKMLLLHSCHNVSADELKNGVTYVSLMKQNYTNLKEALYG